MCVYIYIYICVCVCSSVDSQSRAESVITTRADSRFAPSQWETVLHCNDVSHWLGASLESALTTHTQSVPGLIMGLFQYKDAVLSVHEFPLWR